MGAKDCYLELFMGSKETFEEEKAAFERCVTYCKTETPKLFGSAVAPSGLDDGQREMVQSCYDANPTLGGPLRFVPPTPLLVGRVTMKLYDDKCPKACENFTKVCLASL